MPRRKPSTPQEIAERKLAKRRQDFEAVGLQPDAAVLATAGDIEVSRKTQQTEQAARRSDVFLALCRGMATGAYDAARRLERDILMAAGLSDRGLRLVSVDETTEGRSRMDRMLAARDRLDSLRDIMPEHEFWLMCELIDPKRPNGGQPRSWRDVVGYVTGEELPDAKPALVRNACQSTAWAYRLLDEGRLRCKACGQSRDLVAA